jgi:hypothetical protein
VADAASAPDRDEIIRAIRAAIHPILQERLRIDLMEVTALSAELSDAAYAAAADGFANRNAKPY